MNKELTVNDAWEYLVEQHICSEDVLDIITGIYGYDMQQIDDIVYYYTGYHTFTDLIDEDEYADAELKAKCKEYDNE